MASFKDTEGREWTVRLTVGGLRDIKADTGVDVLARIAHGDTDFLLDPLLILDFLATLLKGQLKERGIDKAALEEAISGAALAASVAAFAEAVQDFSPPPPEGA